MSHLAAYGAMAAVGAYGAGAPAAAAMSSAAGPNAGGMTAPAAAMPPPLDPAVLAALPSLAPTHLLPSLQAHYLPTVPPPSVVDAYKQPPGLISSVGAGVSAAAAAAGVGTALQVRKRFHATDGVRTAQRKKKKIGPPSESHLLHMTRELPDRLDVSSLTNSTLVQQLLALERRLDATIARKHADIQHALLPPKQVSQMTPQVIRLFLWHEHSAGPSGVDALAPESACWMLKMQGHILEADEKVHSNTAPVARCLSNYLSAIVVQIQHSNPPAPTAAAAGTGAAAASASAASAAAASTSSAAPLCETIEWRKHSSVSLSDGFEVRRRGTGDVQVLLSLYQDFSPPRFRIAPRLAQVLGFPLQAPNPAAVHGSGIHAQPFPLLETAGAILTSFWEYVKKHELQDPRQPGLVRCDQALAGVLGVQEMQASSVLAHLQAHLSPAACEPVVIPYHIRASTAAPATTASGLAAAAAAAAAPGLPSPSPSHVQCFDLLTYAPVLPSLTEAYKDASQYSGVKSAPPPSVAAAAARHTEKLSELLLEMDKCNRRREMLQAFSEAPTHVMHCVTAKQAKDQLVMSGVSGVDDELERRGEYYHADWLYDAVDRYQQEETASNNSIMQTAANMFGEGEEE